MHVPTRGRILGEVIEQGETCLIFEKLIVHRALRVHHFGRVALVRGKALLGEFMLCSWLLVFLVFPLLLA